MAQGQPSWQELIQQRTRAGFVGREAERAAFLRNFDTPIGDRRRPFRFHVSGHAGVGKTFLVAELRHLARGRGALTADVDEGAGSVPEAMAEICRQFAAQGRRLKDLERRLATYWERRHEAEAAALAVLAPEPQTPSAGSRAVVGMGLAAVGAAVPGAGLITGALPADLLAQGADRLRAGLSARFRNPEDIDLVLSPEKVLTPVLLAELRAVADAVGWIVLFFDTYERTGPYLDPWLHEMVTRHEGADSGLPATVLVVTAGQRPLDAARWSGLDSVADLPLAPFTEAEARGLLAAKGVVAEPVVEEVLRLTGRLPVLVSTLAQKSPGSAADVRDPSGTAVDLFLKREPEARREVALTCALPRRLDADVLRVLVDGPDDELAVLYEWLTGLPFVGERGGRVRYHDVVRAPMLRLLRRRSPREWSGRQRRLAEAFAHWRADVEAGRDSEELLGDEEWWELRLEETYHALCARPPAALGEALSAFVVACREDEAVGRRWARMLEDAGDAVDDVALRERGRELGEALADEATGVARAMDLLLARPGLDPEGRATAHSLRGRELLHVGEYGRALEEYDRAIEQAPDLALPHHGRGLTLQLAGDFPAALAALDRADELAPHTRWILAERAETHRLAGRFEDAVVDYGRAVALDPTDAGSLTGRAVSLHGLGRNDEALADFDRALRIDGDNLWTLVRRARLLRSRGQSDEAFAEFDRLVALAPDLAWIASERGDTYRLAGRFEDAVAELGRAVALEPDHTSALASRGVALHELGRGQDALADLDRAVELRPAYGWALVMRSRVKDDLGDMAGMFDDLRRAVEVEPATLWFRHELGEAYRIAGRYEEAVAVFHGILERDPDDDETLASLGATHRALKAYEEALSCLDRALAVDPDYGWAYGQRARVCLATGRTERALADLDRCVELGTDSDWARGTAIELLMWCDRRDEAAARLAAADETATADDLGYLHAETHRDAGRWAEARQAAERQCATDPLNGVYQLALTVGRAEGLRAAEPHWREFARLVHESDELKDEERMRTRCLIGCALGDRARADEALAELLAAPDWGELADLATALTDLLHSPGADRTHLTACLTEVTRTRDAVRARYAG
ncbi:tetratricopeptide repeat protein [Streptomyces sp. NPDC005263]|uniref:tetratricopeptide repeat protein n=1 Tax=Streptomyces sp. NPDC005263 TaxID=3364711 RepID=UPI00367A4A7D